MMRACFTGCTATHTPLPAPPPSVPSSPGSLSPPHPADLALDEHVEPHKLGVRVAALRQVAVAAGLGVVVRAEDGRVVGACAGVPSKGRNQAGGKCDARGSARSWGSAARQGLAATSTSSSTCQAACPSAPRQGLTQQVHDLLVLPHVEPALWVCARQGKSAWAASELLVAAWLGRASRFLPKL